MKYRFSLTLIEVFGSKITIMQPALCSVEVTLLVSMTEKAMTIALGSLIQKIEINNY